MSDQNFQQKYPWARFVIEPGTIVPHRVPFPLARRFQQVCATFLAEVYAHEAVKDSEYAALACVDDFPGCDQSRLAALVGIDRTSAGQILDRLEARELIARRVGEEDRRVRLLSDAEGPGAQATDQAKSAGRAGPSAGAAHGERARIADASARARDRSE